MGRRRIVGKPKRPHRKVNCYECGIRFKTYDVDAAGNFYIRCAGKYCRATQQQKDEYMVMNVERKLHG